MRLFRLFMLSPLLAIGLLATAQKSTKGVFGPEDLLEDRSRVVGQGKEIPGLDVREAGVPKHQVGDDPAFAERGFDDERWPFLFKSEDTLVAGASVHWIRYHLYPRTSIRGRALTLDVGTSAQVEAYLNGVPLLRVPASSGKELSACMPLGDSLPNTSVPLRFLADGTQEVLALRLVVPPGTRLSDAGLHVVLREPGTAYSTQRFTMHFGVFIGVNMIILVLALILWSQDRGDKSWLLLGLLSLIQAFDAIADVASDHGLLGFQGRLPEVMDAISRTLAIWPLYLLILVLGGLRGDLAPKNVRRYTWAVGFATVMLALFSFGLYMGGDWITSFFTSGSDGQGSVDTSDGFTFSDPGPWLIALLVVMIVLAVPFFLVFAWFIVDVVRLGIRLLRTKGYVRWVGGGALVSYLVAFLFNILSDSGGVGADWFGIVGEYSAHVAVPVAVAIYLALRSAHHSKAVARQRDDLDREVHERTAELRAEKKRSDDLLLNILPEEVAEELKRTGAAEARHFDQATVMFTDFKGFTTLSEEVTPVELLAELNTCFKAFDDIIARYGIEKIKTIGDAYMCAGGLPDPASSSPLGVVHAALDMQNFMLTRKKQREAEGKTGFSMRSGIHTGPVVAGIVGVKKFQYDIWGDTVNTASRMESSGDVGKVNISEATYQLIKDEPGLHFTSRGRVNAKGKGEMEMYFVQRNEEVSPVD